MSVKSVHTPGNNICTKIMIGEYEISIAQDNSCGYLEECSRSDVKVYVGNCDVTLLFVDDYRGETVPCNADVLYDVMTKARALTERT